MIYPVNIEGFENQTIEVKPTGLFKGPQLLIYGQPAPKGNKRGTMLLRRNDGREVVATWKSKFIGLEHPSLVVDGKEIIVFKPLKWYEYVWSGLPVLLVFVGGGLGAFLGVLGFWFSISIFRSSIKGIFKYALVALITASTVAVYIVLGMLIIFAMHRI
jgi:hypothetical protein